MPFNHSRRSAKVLAILMAMCFLIGVETAFAGSVVRQLNYNLSTACASDGNTGETYRVAMPQLAQNTLIRSVTFFTNASTTVSLFVSVDLGTSTPATNYATITPTPRFVVFSFDTPKFVPAGSNWYIYPPYSVVRTLQYGTTAQTPFTVIDDWAGVGVPCQNGTVVPAFSVDTEIVSVLPDPQTVSFNCSTFDIGCYGKEALYWAFVPSDQSIEQLSNIKSLASTSPMSLLFEAQSMFFDIYAPQVATSSVIRINFLGDDLVIFDTAKIATYLPMAPTIRTFISYFLWLGAFWTVLKIPWKLIF